MIEFSKVSVRFHNHLIFEILFSLRGKRANRSVKLFFESDGMLFIGHKLGHIVGIKLSRDMCHSAGRSNHSATKQGFICLYACTKLHPVKLKHMHCSKKNHVASNEGNIPQKGARAYRITWNLFVRNAACM